MSEENVEIVKAAIDAANRQDWNAAFQEAAPGFELDMSRGLGLMKGVYGDLIRFGRSWRNSPGTGRPFGSSPTNSSKPVISWWCPKPPTGRGVTGSRWYLAPPLCGRSATE
jgi:hypothetical protein